MKNLYPLSSLMLCLALINPLMAQISTELEPGYYVVVGAYAPSRENVAQNYADVLNRKGFTAKYGFNSSRNYYFVYVKYDKALKASLQEMYQTRKRGGEFADAWVRVVSGDIAPDNVATNKPSAEPIAENSIQQTSSNEVYASVKNEPETKLVERKAEVNEVQITAVDPEITDNPEIIQYEKMTLGNTEVFLSLYNARNNRIVEGMVKVIDADRSKLIKEVKGNDYLYLPDPKSKSGKITLQCEAFGYRKVQHEIHYPMPLADTSQAYIDLMGTTFIVNFDLVRYHKGDIGTLFHVYFYNDAALMLPESKFELNSLLQMMKENENYRVKLHGHTNGNYHGKIVTMGPDKNIFSLDGSRSTIGSAKDLSKARAEVIKEYLVENGIDPSRVEIKAWGGKRPIHDKHGANAKKNVRVEVEILAD
jgi:outer membrane protein OmpA-like peptidoglycan-associated protein